MRRHSPYNFAFNNPINFIDPDGMAPRRFAMASENSPMDVNWGERNYYLGSFSTPAYDYLSGPMASGGSNSYLLDDLRAGWAERGFGSSISGNGYLKWWTGTATQTSYMMNGQMYGEGNLGTMHSVKLNDDTFWDGVTKKLGVFGFANDVKIQLIEAGVRSNAGLTIKQFNGLNTAAQELRTLGALGYTGSKYLSAFKNLGVAASIVTTAYSATKVYNQYQEGGANEVFSHRDVIDTTVGVIGLGTTALVAVGLVSNPVGWAIGIGVLAYGTGTMLYDLANEP